jgi:hypothetical protein
MYKDKVKTVCIDFDGVIVDNSEGYLGCGVFGDLLPNVVDSINELFIDEFWRVIIYTSREETDLVESFLNRKGIPFSAVIKKVRADVYIDDRGLNFGGREAWPHILNETKNFKSWSTREMEDK